MKTIRLLFVRKKAKLPAWVCYDEIVHPDQKPVLNSIYFQGWADPKADKIKVSVQYPDL